MSSTVEVTRANAESIRENPLEVLADFTVSAKIGQFPSAVLDTAKSGIIDLLGVMVMGARDPAMAPLLKYVDETYSDGASSVFGLTAGKVAEAAAYANAASGHVLDFDDCHDTLGGHPTVVVLPAVLALAEALNLDSSSVIEAYVIGVEVEGVLGRCLNHVHYERGWHPTATLGIFGATAVAARLLDLDQEATMRAFAISASFASGIKGNFGTFMKAGQVGFAVSKGVQAARLAKLGVTANTNIFSGGHSFPDVYNSQKDIDWSPLQSLGKRWSMIDPGLVFKLYPCCGSTHAPIDAMLELRERHHLDAKDISKIEVFVHPRRMPHTNRPQPHTGLEGKFSSQYVVATAALNGAVTVQDFDEARIAAKDVQELLEVTELLPLPVEDQTILPGRLDCFAASVRVTKLSGEQLELHVDAPKGGDPANPISRKDLETKFVVGITEVAGKAKAEELLSVLETWMNGTQSSHELMKSFAGVAKKEA